MANNDPYLENGFGVTGITEVESIDFQNRLTLPEDGIREYGVGQQGMIDGWTASKMYPFMTIWDALRRYGETFQLPMARDLGNAAYRACAFYAAVKQRQENQS